MDQHHLVQVDAFPGQGRGIGRMRRVQPEHAFALFAHPLHQRQKQMQLTNTRCIQKAFTQGTPGPAQAAKLVIQNLISGWFCRLCGLDVTVPLPDTGILHQRVQKLAHDKNSRNTV